MSSTAKKQQVNSTLLISELNSLGAMAKYRELNEEEFSAVTGIPVRTLQTMRSRPELKGPPYIKRGKAVRYTLASYDKYLASLVVDPRDLKKVT